MKDTIKSLCDFLDASPTAFHAVDSMAALLDAVGARRLGERESWELEPGATYYLVRNGTALVAFRPGLEARARAGFALAAAHTDSPALKVRVEKELSGKGMNRVAVEVYGAPILSTWLDRPLSLAGRVIVRRGGGTESRLVNLARPIGVVPNLAIHLNRDMNKGFEYNAHNHLPVLVSAAGAEEGMDRSFQAGAMPMGEGETAAAATRDATALRDGAVPWTLRLVAGELGISPGDILAGDLFFVDAQRALILGEKAELVNAPRLDDLLGCHAILEAFLEVEPTAQGQVALFLDNEEVGSRTPQGADSSFVRDLLARICSLSGCSSDDFYRALASSFCVSVDAAQAWHPSYAEKYDEGYSPLVNGGPAVKSNASFRYATDAESASRFRLYCEEAGSPCQKYMSRADSAPGTTIGPLGASLTGIATVDVGAPLLAMHSARETAGTLDHSAMISSLSCHFRRRPREALPR